MSTSERPGSLGEVFQVLVIGVDNCLMIVSFEIVSPLFEGCNNRKSFVMNLIVHFGTVELLAVEGYETLTFVNDLRDNIAYCNIRGIYFHYIFSFQCEVAKDRCSCEHCLQ